MITIGKRRGAPFYVAGFGMAKKERAPKDAFSSGCVWWKLGLGNLFGFVTALALEVADEDQVADHQKGTGPYLK